MPMLDTLEIFKELKENFSEEQASTLSRIFQEAIKPHLEDLSTKRDLKELDASLKRDIKEMETRLQHDMKEMETRLQHDMKEMETRLQHGMAEMETRLQRDMAELKIDIIKWVMGMMLIQSGIIVGGFFAAVKMLMEK